MSWNELPLGWLPLVDAVVKTTMILIGAACVSLALRRASAALRHLVWTLALCSALALPILSMALPKWQLAVVTIASEPAVDASVAAAPSLEPAPDVQAPPLRSRESAAVAGAPIATGAVTPAPASSSAWTAAIRDITWPQALFALWLAGALAVFSRVLIGLVAVRWLSRRTTEITDAAWLPMARAIASELRVTQRLRFLRSGRASMPVAAGILRPSVIMPADADTWCESRLRIVLLHELAHVKRRDCLTHLVAQIACALYWFNPLAWLAVKRARTERERACDDLVLAYGTRGSDYADQLLEMARALRGDRLPGLMAGASLAMAQPSQLEGRLMAILDPRVPRAGVSRARGLAAVVLCCCAVAPLGALQPWTTDGAQVNYAVVPNTGTVDRQATAPAAAAPTTPATRESMAAPAAVPEREHSHDADHDADKADVAEAVVAAAPQPHPMPQPMPMPVLGDVLGSFATAAVRAVEGIVEQDAQKSADKAADKAAEAKKSPGGRQADPRMIAALTAALKDTDKEVRETAMHALVQLRDPSIFDPLVQALKDGSPDVREQAAHGLGQLRDRRAVQPLIAALKDEHADVREQVAFALGQIRDVAAVEGLALAVRDAAPDVREQAVFALSQIRDRRATAPLISALKDAVADVRQQAAFALGQLRDPAAVDALVVAVRDADKEVREQVVFALGQIRVSDSRVIDALTTALKDQNPEVRRQAAFALGQIAR